MLNMDTSCLSHSRAITVIKDPVHDNIRLSCFDREIVDSAYFQRLHFVLQNSNTYVAFPSNKNSRFSHSLGVSHLCGKLLTNALGNSSKQDFDIFLKNIAGFLKQHFVMAGDGQDILRLRNGWEQTISGQSQFRHSPSLKVNITDPADDEPQTIGNEAIFDGFPAGFIVDTLWQTLRICGLAHDIGHLPMSHSLEGALEKFNKSVHEERNLEKGLRKRNQRDTVISDDFADITGHDDYLNVIKEFEPLLKSAFGSHYDQDEFGDGLKSFPLHEKRSLLILNLLMKNNALQFKGVTRDYRTLLYKFAFLILFSTIRSDQDALSPTDDAAFSSYFKVLKLIVAGAIDGDRMDYTIRDGLSCGSTIGNFDINRIVENAILYQDRRTTKNIFRIGFFSRSLSGIEQFFTQRHQGYKYLIYHRTSSRSEACLQELVCQILQFCFQHPNHKFTLTVEKFGYIRRRTDGKKFDIFPTDPWVLKCLDDSNLRTLLIWLDHLIDTERSTFSITDLDYLDRISVLTKIFLYREFVHIYDPLKNNTMTARLRGLLGDEYHHDQFQSVVRLIAFTEETRSDYIRDAEKFFKSNMPSSYSVVISVQLPKIYDHARSRKKGEEVYLLHSPIDETGRVPATSVIEGSPTLGGMPRLYGQEFKINCYFIGKEIKKSQLVSCEHEQTSELDKVFNQFLLKSYPKLLRLAEIKFEKSKGAS